jgi:hypothetical protein
MRQAQRVKTYLLYHVHEPSECGVVYASFKGHETPLRRQSTVASCHFGGHAIWWIVRAMSERDALASLPYFVASRTSAILVRDVRIP